MSNTQSAHVCTNNRARLIPITGSIGFADADAKDRRFWVVNMVAPSDVPPPAALRFDDVLLPRVEQIKRPKHTDPNCIWIGVDEVNDVLLTRHHDESMHRHYPERANKWIGHMIRSDEVGRKWHRCVTCVVNDFGWLVEVPTC